MDNCYQHLDLKICNKHNLPIILFDKQQNQHLCLTCVQEKTGIVHIDEFQLKHKEIVNQIKNEFQEKQQQLEQLFNSILRYKQNIIYGIDKMNQIIIDQIKSIQYDQKIFQQQLANNFEQDYDQFKNYLKNQQDNNQHVLNLIKQLFFDFQQKFLKIDPLSSILPQSSQIFIKQFNDSSKTKEQNKIQEFRQEKIENKRKLQFSSIFVGELGKKQSEYCYALAFTKDNSNLIVGCNSLIKIYQFSNGRIGKELQVLQNHKQFVYCLYAMKQSNCFISGSYDFTIIIWKLDFNNQWIPQQMLNEHQGDINCLLMNKNEDLLISGSVDTTVKFWKIENNQWSCNQTIKTDRYNSVYALSLNDKEDKLITCGSGAYILVMKMQKDQQWNIKQTINVNEYGLRLCFTLNNQFIFQPKTKDYLEIYDYNCSPKQFYKLSRLKIQGCEKCCTLFPCQYINSQRMLQLKHGQFLNIFKINEDGDYELVQTIEYNDFCFFGTVSNDGKYLVTWDKESQEIKVRTMK